MLKKYIDLHLTFLKRVLFKFLLLFNGNVFSSMCNVLFMLKGLKTRFTYLRDGMYVVREGLIEQFFENRVQALHVYHDGLEARAKNLEASYFLNKVHFNEDDLVIDCGANVGDLSLFFRLKHLSIRYMGIEPSIKEFNALKKNAGEGNCHNLGLWHEESNLKFFVSSDGADSSLIEPPKYDRIVHVKTVRLDSLVHSRVKLLKIEAEGAEPEVLEGALGVLEHVEYVSADLGFERGLAQESTLIPVVNFMFKNDFELVDISHVRVCALFRNKRFNS